MKAISALPLLLLLALTPSCAPAPERVALARGADISGPPTNVWVFVIAGDAYQPPVASLYHVPTGAISSPGYPFDGAMGMPLARIDDDDAPCYAPVGADGMSGILITHDASDGLAGTDAIVDEFAYTDPTDTESASGLWGLTLAGIPHAVYGFATDPIPTCYLSADQEYPAIFAPGGLPTSSP